MTQFLLAHLFSIVGGYLLLLGASFVTFHAFAHKRLGRIAKGIFNSLLLLIPWGIEKLKSS